ncbi:MAG: ABC transporter permease subunit [Myxococcota bacterium]|nr:ABC transporter permease subunit [Myxococcota bacterium]
MKTTLAIYRRELSAFFNSALAYIAIPLFLLLVGLFSLYLDDLFDRGMAHMGSVFRWMALFLVLLIPAITMRMLAEERRSGGLELIQTLPVSDAQIVLGKFLAALTVIWLGLALTLSYPITLSRVGALDWGPVVGGYVGLALMSAGYCAIGLAVSAFTKSQILAFLGAMTLCLVPYAMGFFLEQVPASWVPLVQQLSFDYHFSSLARGVLDTRNLIFYISVVLLALHVAVFALEERRLRA